MKGQPMPTIAGKLLGRSIQKEKQDRKKDNMIKLYGILYPILEIANKESKLIRRWQCNLYTGLLLLVGE